MESAGLQLVEIRTRDFPVTGLETLLKNLGLQIRHGRGMAVLRGIPVGDFDLPQIEKLYWGLLTHLGTGITQNRDAGLIHYVTDGSLRPNQGKRGVGRPGESCAACRSHRLRVATVCPPGHRQPIQLTGPLNNSTQRYLGASA